MSWIVIFGYVIPILISYGILVNDIKNYKQFLVRDVVNIIVYLLIIHIPVINALLLSSVLADIVRDWYRTNKYKVLIDRREHNDQIDHCNTN